MKPTIYTENIKNAESNVPLFHQYPNNLRPQNAYIEIDLHTGRVMADWDGNVGGGIPIRVADGEVLRIYIPPMVSKTALLDKLADEEFLITVGAILDAYAIEEKEAVETLIYNLADDVQNMVFFDVDDLMGIYENPYEYIGDVVLPYSGLSEWSSGMSLEYYAKYLMENIPDNTEIRGGKEDWCSAICEAVVHNYAEEDDIDQLEPHQIYEAYEYLDTHDEKEAKYLRDLVEGGQLYGDAAIAYAKEHKLPLYHKDEVVELSEATGMSISEGYELHVKISDMG